MRCAYCHSESAGAYCGADCEQKNRAFERYVKKFGTTFLILTLLLTLLLLALLLAPLIIPGSRAQIVGLYFILQGLVFTAFPFTGPETVASLGVRRSIKLGRGIGMSFIVFGVLLLAWFFWG